MAFDVVKAPPKNEKGMMGLHIRRKIGGNDCAIAFVHTQHVVDQVYSLIGGPYKKKPVAREGCIVGKMVGNEQQGTYFEIKVAPKHVEYAVKKKMETEFSKELLFEKQ